MLSYAFLLAIFVPALVSARTEGVRECSGGHPAPYELRIEGCAQTPCDVFQGSDAVMEIDFRAVNVHNTLRPQVFATALGATIEYTLPPQFSNGCNQLTTGSCPLSQNEDATYRFVFPITNIYPPIPVSIQLTLFDHVDSVVFCGHFDIHVRLR